MASQAHSGALGGGGGGRGGGNSGAGGADSGAPAAPVLVGDVGQEYVQNTLTTMDPLSAIQDIQAHGALQDPACRPLIGLLDQLGLTRWVGGLVARSAGPFLCLPACRCLGN